MWFEDLISLSSYCLLNHFIFSIWMTYKMKLPSICSEIPEKQNTWSGIQIGENTFYCLSQGCHWLEDDLNELLSARPQHVADKQKTMRSCRSSSLSLAQYHFNRSLIGGWYNVKKKTQLDYNSRHVSSSPSFTSNQIYDFGQSPSPPFFLAPVSLFINKWERNKFRWYPGPFSAWQSINQYIFI